MSGQVLELLFYEVELVLEDGQVVCLDVILFEELNVFCHESRA